MTRPLSIAILGTRGVPPRYGGFETFAAELGTRLAARGHRVTVYCRSYLYPERPSSWNGVDLVHLPAIEQKYLETVSHALLSAMHVIFGAGSGALRSGAGVSPAPDGAPRCGAGVSPAPDFAGIPLPGAGETPAPHHVAENGELRTENGFDVVLLCNAANAFVVPLLRAARIPVATNVDGIERKRKKWNALGKLVYLTGEALAAHFSTRVVADATTIARYYRDAFDVRAETIAYGSDFPDEPDTDVLAGLGVAPGGYVLYVSRFEPENHPLEVAQGFLRAGADVPLVMVGSAPYSSELILRLEAVAQRSNGRILLPGAIYGAGYRTLQRNARLYIQATEVGGTHPALIEAMGSNGVVLALDTAENREVGGDSIRYFRFDGRDSLEAVLSGALREDSGDYRARARTRARARYAWDAVTDAYEKMFLEIRGME